jgi:hypothetical protein
MRSEISVSIVRTSGKERSAAFGDRFESVLE